MGTVTALSNTTSGLSSQLIQWKRQENAEIAEHKTLVDKIAELASKETKGAASELREWHAQENSAIGKHDTVVDRIAELATKDTQGAASQMRDWEVQVNSTMAQHDTVSDKIAETAKQLSPQGILSYELKHGTFTVRKLPQLDWAAKGQKLSLLA